MRNHPKGCCFNTDYKMSNFRRFFFFMIIFSTWDASDPWQNSPQSFSFLIFTAAGAGWSFEDAAGCWLHSRSSPSSVLLPFSGSQNQRPNPTQHAPLTISCHLMKENLAATPLAWCAVERTNSRPQKLFVLRETPFSPPPNPPPWLIDSNQTHRGGVHSASLAFALRRLIRLRRQRLKTTYKYLTRAKMHFGQWGRRVGWGRGGCSAPAYKK